MFQAYREFGTFGVDRGLFDVGFGVHGVGDDWSQLPDGRVASAGWTARHKRVYRGARAVSESIVLPCTDCGNSWPHGTFGGLNPHY